MVNEANGANNGNESVSDEELPEQMRIRREKRAGLLARGENPYPVLVPRTATLKEIRARHGDLPKEVSTGIIESVTGRVIFRRDAGKLCFATLREGDGSELQGMFSLDKIGQERLDFWKTYIDLGDFVSGIEKVFEINRNFRNEGADSSHSPEFVMIETYWAYSDWNQMADLTRCLVQEAATAVFGSHVVTHHDGRENDLGGSWREVNFYDAISESVGEKITPQTSKDSLIQSATKLGIKVDPSWITGKLAEEIFEHVYQDKLIAPTFVKGFPIDTSPLVRQHRDIEGLAEKWDLYIDGFELATGYSELIDPVIQRERLVEQAKLGASGDLEAMGLDEDFLRAMEFGMPPMGGMGMGVDRLLMALTGLGIRETILFPLVKPEEN